MLILATVFANALPPCPGQTDGDRVKLVYPPLASSQNDIHEPSPGGAERSGTAIKDGGTVQQTWKRFVNLPGENFQDRAGFQTVVSGDSSTVAISSPMASPGGLAHAGSVTIYARLGTTWEVMGEPIIGETALEQSGYSIALDFSGNTVAIGSPYYNRTNEDLGAAANGERSRMSARSACSLSTAPPGLFSASPLGGRSRMASVASACTWAEEAET